ncbi:hypothetical protein FHY25_001531 [Xanthomonas arboricola]|nr:hypothetical protein [Xanthomonas campestris]MCW2006950.1 hypothetical protein [Xanthomonas campestris]
MAAFPHINVRENDITLPICTEASARVGRICLSHCDAT